MPAILLLPVLYLAGFGSRLQVSIVMASSAVPCWLFQQATGQQYYCCHCRTLLAGLLERRLQVSNIIAANAAPCCFSNKVQVSSIIPSGPFGLSTTPSHSSSTRPKPSGFHVGPSHPHHQIPQVGHGKLAVLGNYVLKTKNFLLAGANK